MNDTQWYDLIIEKDGIFETVQCKATETKEDTIDFRSTGGTKGKEYDNIQNYQGKLTYIFCVNKDLNMWLIPIKDLKDVKKSIRLRKEPNSNN